MNTGCEIKIKKVLIKPLAERLEELFGDWCEINPYRDEDWASFILDMQLVHEGNIKQLDECVRDDKRRKIQAEISNLQDRIEELKREL